MGPLLSIFPSGRTGDPLTSETAQGSFGEQGQTRVTRQPLSEFEMGPLTNQKNGLTQTYVSPKFARRHRYSGLYMTRPRASPSPLLFLSCLFIHFATRRETHPSRLTTSSWPHTSSPTLTTPFTRLLSSLAAPTWAAVEEAEETLIVSSPNNRTKDGEGCSRMVKSSLLPFLPR